MILEVNILTEKRVEAQVGGRDTTPAKWRGEWKSEETYLTLQKVSREGSSYVCIKSCVGVDPVEDVGEGAEGTYWILIAKRGDNFTYDDFTPEQLEALKGAPGNPGKDGSPGADGNDGVGIASIEQTTTSTVDGGDNVFTVTLTNGAKATFVVKNGSKGSIGPAGADGQPGSPGADGNDGVGIASIEQTTISTADGGDNVFTVTLTNGKKATFTVKNGSKGSTGADGADGQPGENGKSAYQYAKEAGYTGTEEEFAEKLAREDTGGGSGEAGKDGVTFIPSVDSSGNISWTNDGGLENPATVNIRGPRGYQGYNGQDGQDGQDGEDGRDGYSVNVRSVVSESDRTIITLYDEKSDSEKRITVYNGTDGYDGQDGEDGVGISSIAQTTISSADGGNNVFTVTLTNGAKATFTVKNGSKGSTGTAGKDGSNGADGQDGADGITPHIGTNGNWYIGTTDTGISATGPQGPAGSDASVTATNIKTALGYTPASESKAEAWTFTLEDGSAVTKKVVLA